MNIELTRLREPHKPFRPVLKDSVEYRELADSIRKEGILQPLLVRPVDDFYEVVEGNHRYHGAREAGLTSVPCLVREMTDDEVLLYQLKVQALRPKVNPMDIAKRLQELMDDGMSLGALAAYVGKSPHWVRSRLLLRNLHKEAQACLDDGSLGVSSGVALAKLPKSIQKEVLDAALTLPSVEFVEKARVLLKDYREKVKQGRLENLLNPEPQPYLRTMTEIREEVVTFRAAGIHLQMDEAQTALDGWKSCLKWLLHLDPLSLRNQIEKQERAQAERLNAFKRRKANRDLRNKLLGDHKHD